MKQLIIKLELKPELSEVEISQAEDFAKTVLASEPELEILDSERAEKRGLAVGGLTVVFLVKASATFIGGLGALELSKYFDRKFERNEIQKVVIQEQE